MEYCKLRCKANKQAFKEIVDEINNGGGGGGGVTKLTITTDTELYDALDNANNGDNIIISAFINNGSNYFQLEFSGIIRKRTPGSLYIVGNGVGDRSTGTVRVNFWGIIFSKGSHSVSMCPVDSNTPWGPLSSIENINATMIKY